MGATYSVRCDIIRYILFFFLWQELPADIFSVVIGEHNIRDDNTNDPKRKVLEIEKTIIHEDYCLYQVHDIALLKLKEKVDLSIYTPACLAPADADYTGKTASLYGWGTEEDAASCASPQPAISPLLKETTQTIISNEECEQGSGFAPCCDDNGIAALCKTSMLGRVKDDMLCGYNSGRDSFQGDSGGPFTVEEDGKHTLVGIVSWGKGCARVSTHQ